MAALLEVERLWVDEGNWRRKTARETTERRSQQLGYSDSSDAHGSI